MSLQCVPRGQALNVVKPADAQKVQGLLHDSVLGSASPSARPSVSTSKDVSSAPTPHDLHDEDLGDAVVRSITRGDSVPVVAQDRMSALSVPDELPSEATVFSLSSELQLQASQSTGKPVIL